MQAYEEIRVDDIDGKVMGYLNANQSALLLSRLSSKVYYSLLA